MLKRLTEHILLGKKMINFFDKGDLNFDKLINIFIFFKWYNKAYKSSINFQILKDAMNGLDMKRFEKLL
jgi:hypothetical protein